MPGCPSSCQRSPCPYQFPCASPRLSLLTERAGGVVAGAGGVVAGVGGVVAGAGGVVAGAGAYMFLTCALITVCVSSEHNERPGGESKASRETEL